VPKIIKFGGDLTKFWQKQVESFFGTPCTGHGNKTQVSIGRSYSPSSQPPTIQHSNAVRETCKKNHL